MGDQEINPRELDVIREFIREKTGIFIPPEKNPALQNSLQIRLQTVERSNLGKYLNYIKYHPDGGEELKEVIKLITITKSDFFRNPPQYEALEKWVLPELLQHRDFKELAVWSAGCSTGEEPYSIALSLLRVAGTSPPFPFQILATDINQTVLNQAEQGIFPRRRLTSVPQSLLQRYFLPAGEDRFQVSDPVRRMVTFRFHNLASPEFPLPAAGAWNIIFCRNVSIYFDLKTTRELMEKFYGAIAEGGYLFIGHSESLFRVFEKFKLVEKGNILIYRKEKAPAPRTAGGPRIAFSPLPPPGDSIFPNPCPPRASTLPGRPISRARNRRSRKPLPSTCISFPSSNSPS